MKQVVFATGNDEKVRDAELALKQFNISIVKKLVTIDEIQHDDPVEIAIKKARSSYECIQTPLIINDSAWDIPALNGFPGGYMKDITSWLTTDDFISLMSKKEDKRIFLHEVVIYIDEQQTKIFQTSRKGTFTDTPAGSSLPSFARVVKMEGDDITISEIFDKKGARNLDPRRYEHWNVFGRWYRGYNE